MTISKTWVTAWLDDSSTTTPAASGAFNSTGYTHIVFWSKHEGATTVQTPADNAGTTWTAGTLRSHSNGDIHGQMFWGQIGTPRTGHTVSSSYAAARPYSRFGVWLINATTGAITNVGDIFAQSSGTAINAGNLTPTDEAVLFNGVGEYAATSYTPGTGWTQDWDFNESAGSNGYGQSRYVTTGGTYAADCTQTAGAPWLSVAVAFIEAGGSGPNIASVDDTTPQQGSSLVITGTAFGATQGAGSVTIGGISQSIVSWSDTSITVTVNIGTNPYGETLNVQVITDAEDTSNSFPLSSIQPATGWSFVNIVTPNSDPDLRLESSPDLGAGDQVLYQTLSGTVEVFDDGTFSVASGVTSFNFYVWTDPDGWGSMGTQTIDDGHVEQTNACAYQVINAVQQTNSPSYLVAAGVQSSNTSSYAVVGSVQATDQATYSVVGSAQQTNAVVYSVISHAQTTNAVSYAVITAVQQTVAAAYLLINAVQQTNAASYSIDSATSVQQTNVASYNVIQAIQDTNTANFNVVASVQNTGNSVYSIIGAVQQTVAAGYQLLNAAQVTNSAAYQLINAVQASNTSAYDFEGVLSVTNTAVYSVIAAVQATSPASYQIQTSAQQTNAGSYQILGSAQQTNVVNYAMAGTVQQANVTLYELLDIITQTQAANYQIQSAVAQTGTVTFAIQGSVQATNSSSYLMSSVVMASLLTTYEVISDIIAPSIGTIRRTLKVPLQLRTLKV